MLGFHSLLVLLFGLTAVIHAERLRRVTGRKETFMEKTIRLAYDIESNPQWKEEFAQRVRLGKEILLPPIHFNCTVEPSPSNPTSAHAVRPSDIKVLGAYGDSISAGNGLGAENGPQVAIENRGEVFTIGGDYTLDAGVITLTNFFRGFNPDVKGYSVCQSTRDNVARSWLNVAEPGGDNRDMPTQSNMIVERMRNDERIDYDNDWKLISLFVGGNDLCGSCDNWDRYSPEAYEAKFREAIDILFNNTPRAIVNLIAMFDVTPLQNFSTGPGCDWLQINFCDCAINDTTRPQLRQTQLGYYEALKNITEDPKYLYGREDFAVVLQPHMRDMEPPRDPETGEYLPGFLAPDCFHPNRIAHQFFAFTLWNTLLIPVGHKPFVYDMPTDMGTPINASCPTTQHPYIFTNLNSDVPWP